MFEVKLSPEDVNKFVTEAILKSALGEQLTEAINKALREALDGYNSPVKKLVSEAVTDQVRAVLNLPENKTKITEFVHKHFTDEIIVTLLSRSVDNAVKAMKEDRYCDEQL